MTSAVNELSMRSGARIAGVAIVIMLIAAIVGTDGTINRLVEDDPAATVNNLTSAIGTFRIGVFSWLIILIADLFAAWGLYIFFKPVNKDISLVMAWSRLVYVALLGTALSNYIKVMFLFQDNALVEMGDKLLQLEVMQSLEGFQHVWAFGLIVFAIHIFFVGYLILTGNSVPKILGYLLIAAFVGYLVLQTMTLFFPDYERARTVIGWIFILPMLSEVALGVWMLIRGTKFSSPNVS